MEPSRSKSSCGTDVKCEKRWPVSSGIIYLFLILVDDKRELFPYFQGLSIHLAVLVGENSRRALGGNGGTIAATSRKGKDRRSNGFYVNLLPTETGKTSLGGKTTCLVSFEDGIYDDGLRSDNFVLTCIYM